jgi:hypothetical protein
VHYFYPYYFCVFTVLQLFLEEERERELEQIYDSALTDSLNRTDTAVGSEANADGRLSTEVAAVTKQTTETLMAGERIMEALDLADNERATFGEFEEQKARAGTLEAAGLQPPPRNPILAALDLEPEAYVLRVVEKVPSTALQDALLVLPFGKVLSLMRYLDMWAQKVISPGKSGLLYSEQSKFITGVEHNFSLAYHILPPEDSPPPDCGEPDNANDFDPDAHSLTKCAETRERHHWVQSCCLAIYPPQERGRANNPVLRGRGLR